jgi:hypothetical protein
MTKKRYDFYQYMDGTVYGRCANFRKTFFRNFKSDLKRLVTEFYK